jgi:hypothetical protein
MSKIIELPRNFIGKEDKERLESFGGHLIAHGRATRWHWSRNGEGDDIFEIYTGGANERLSARVNRDRDLDAFCAAEGSGRLIVAGPLDHVMAALDEHFARLHDELI